MKERLERLMHDLGLNQLEFAQKCGISRSTLATMGDTLSATNIRKILLIYDNLDARWLITGQGDMWMTPNHEHIVTDVNPAEVTFLRELVKSQQETIRLLVEKRAGNSQSIQL